MSENDPFFTFERASSLNALALYHADVARLPRLSRAEQAELVALARTGHQEAREQLLLNCLHWALLRAHQIYDERRPCHVDILDLAQVANLKMLETMDQALTARDPTAYLMTVAAQAIRVYCTYHAPLIQRPEWLSRRELADLEPALSPMRSLDAPSGEGDVSPQEQLAAPPLELASEAQQHQYAMFRFARLYQAVKRLNRSQRAAVVRLYGLFGQPCETMSDIAGTSHLTFNGVRGRACEARKHLRRLLTSELV